MMFGKIKSGKDHGKILAALKKIWRFSDLKRSYKEQFKLAPNLYKCEGCEQSIYTNKHGDIPYHYKTKYPDVIKDGVDVDHKEPAVDPSTGWVDYNTYIKRLLDCGAENLQLLCKGCHFFKTQSENVERHENKKEAKKRMS